MRKRQPSKKYIYLVRYAANPEMVSNPDSLPIVERFDNYSNAVDFGMDMYGPYGVHWIITKQAR